MLGDHEGDNLYKTLQLVNQTTPIPDLDQYEDKYEHSELDHYIFEFYLKHVQSIFNKIFHGVYEDTLYSNVSLLKTMKKAPLNSKNVMSYYIKIDKNIYFTLRNLRQNPDVGIIVVDFVIPPMN
jgi:deoxyadenosine/deoxycytidine kinase